ncbi:unnamed protein product [Spirodela intermedia]|uniref:Uncharacterized protein n=1 Tax=Spirodela intermedia TaxID=51605 RepID=A0A7I8IPX5_SPIIN|nr:unnamed protein product [Spirodela intermedia]CAA6659543.1 unnamed protein product [Spirodela intermedia]
MRRPFTLSPFFRLISAHTSTILSKLSRLNLFVAGIASSWLLFSAIPTLLAFKRAAESIEKLLDATREELPDTMAAVRLSGMEISDLTMELSELGQEISQGVRSSTRAVRQAEGRLRGLMAAPPKQRKAAAIRKSK